MRQLNIKAPLVFRLGVVLFCAMLITFSMMGGLYARYSTTVTGEASAKVAKFDVKVTGDDGNTDIVVNVSSATDDGSSCTITITNKSEVTVQYTLSVSSIAGINAAFDSSSSSGTLKFDDEIECDLTFTVEKWDLITENMTGNNGSISFDFTVTVNIEQVD